MSSSSRDRPRLLKVVLPHFGAQKRILSQARFLRNFPFRRVCMRPSLTFAGRQVRARLATQLRYRRERGELDLVISQREIISRPQRRSLPSVNHYPDNRNLGLPSLFNAWSILKRITELHHFLDSSKSILIGITETWLSFRLLNSALTAQRSSSVLRSDRESKGGDVILLIYNDVCDYEAFSCQTVNAFF